MKKFIILFFICCRIEFIHTLAFERKVDLPVAKQLYAQCSEANLLKTFHTILWLERKFFSGAFTPKLAQVWVQIPGYIAYRQNDLTNRSIQMHAILLELLGSGLADYKQLQNASRTLLPAEQNLLISLLERRQLFYEMHKLLAQREIEKKEKFETYLSYMHCAVFCALSCTLYLYIKEPITKWLIGLSQLGLITFRLYNSFQQRKQQVNYLQFLFQIFKAKQKRDEKAIRAVRCASL